MQRQSQGAEIRELGNVFDLLGCDDLIAAGAQQSIALPAEHLVITSTWQLTGKYSGLDNAPNLVCDVPHSPGPLGLPVHRAFRA